MTDGYGYGGGSVSQPARYTAAVVTSVWVCGRGQSPTTAAPKSHQLKPTDTTTQTCPITPPTLQTHLLVVQHTHAGGFAEHQPALPPPRPCCAWPPFDPSWRWWGRLCLHLHRWVVRRHRYCCCWCCCCWAAAGVWRKRRGRGHASANICSSARCDTRYAIESRRVRIPVRLPSSPLDPCLPVLVVFRSRFCGVRDAGCLNAPPPGRRACPSLSARLLIRDLWNMGVVGWLLSFNREASIRLLPIVDRPTDRPTNLPFHPHARTAKSIDPVCIYPNPKPLPRSRPPVADGGLAVIALTPSKQGSGGARGRVCITCFCSNRLSMGGLRGCPHSQAGECAVWLACLGVVFWDTTRPPGFDLRTVPS